MIYLTILFILPRCVYTILDRHIFLLYYFTITLITLLEYFNFYDAVFIFLLTNFMFLYSVLFFGWYYPLASFESSSLR